MPKYKLTRRIEGPSAQDSAPANIDPIQTVTSVKPLQGGWLEVTGTPSGHDAKNVTVILSPDECSKVTIIP